MWLDSVIFVISDMPYLKLWSFICIVMYLTFVFDVFNTT